MARLSRTLAAVAARARAQWERLAREPCRQVDSAALAEQPRVRLELERHRAERLELERRARPVPERPAPALPPSAPPDCQKSDLASSKFSRTPLHIRRNLNPEDAGRPL